MRQTHCASSIQMLKALRDASVSPQRQAPTFLWAVQSFNMHNLRNSRISPEQLVTKLRNATGHAPVSRTSPICPHETRMRPPTSLHGAAVLCGPNLIAVLYAYRLSILLHGAVTRLCSLPLAGATAATVMGAQAAEVSHWLVGSLFESVRLIPVRRPHWDDEVTANMATRAASSLSAGYLADADTLRQAALSNLAPAHRCAGEPRRSSSSDGRSDSTLPRLIHPSECDMRPWDGPAFVDALNSWLKYGHIVEGGGDLQRNETTALQRLSEAQSEWLKKQCSGLKEALRKKMRQVPAGNNSEAAARRDRVYRTALGQVMKLRAH